MKLSEAISIINGVGGFRVHFEIRGGGVLKADYFPEKDEDLIPTSEAAWKLAGDFSRSCSPNIVNIYVVDHNNRPVPGYENRKYKKY